MGKTTLAGGIPRAFTTQHDREVIARTLLAEAKRLLARLTMIPGEVDDCATAPHDDRTRPGYLGTPARPEVVDRAPIERIRSELDQEIEIAFQRIIQARR